MPIPWTSELWTYKGDLSGAKTAFSGLIESLKEKTDTNIVRVALSDTRSNFRKRIAGRYKANRATKDKPILFKALRDYLRSDYGAEVMPALEGDDLVSMWATDPATENPVVCSIDKDCKTIPGHLYNPHKGEYMRISPATAEWHFLEQVLTGDRVDGYDGCPLVGPKRALMILDTKEDGLTGAWPAIVRAYEKAGLSESVALENARCARLLRHGEYREGAVKLWTPDGSDEWLELATT